jgi:hypothetical protein
MGTADSAQANRDPRCGWCNKPIPEDDRFCRYCGYSRKKCATCGKKQIDAGGGKYCPSCGAARSGQEVIRTSPAYNRAGGIRFFVKYVGAPVVVLLIAALALTQPTIPRSTAQSFLDVYFKEATNTGRLGQLYAQELTPSYKQFISQETYDGFWKMVRSVVPDPVYPVSGNPDEFSITYTIYYRPGTLDHSLVHGGSEIDTENYWLVCTGFRGNFLGKIPGLGCPEYALKIDLQQTSSSPFPGESG